MNTDESQSSDSDEECRCLECGVRCGYRQLCGRTMCDNALFGTTGVCMSCDVKDVLLVDDERCGECAVPVSCVACGQNGVLGGGLSMFCACRAYCDACIEHVGANCRVCGIRGPYVMRGRRAYMLNHDTTAAICV